MKKLPKKVKEIREFVARAEKGSKNISFSQLSLYVTCPYRWYRAYIKKEAPYSPSIHTVFGTAFHETMQKWLDLLYNDSVKASEEFDYRGFLLERLRTIYQNEKASTGKDFTTPEELASFYEDGLAILEFVKKHRKVYFSPKEEYLVGCEIPILYPLRSKFYFKGFIDFLIYNKDTDRWKIFDIKTSTSGWSAETKSDFNKTSQTLLYKKYLSELFSIDQEKIDVEYFIVKRKINEDAPYPAMKKRVQEFVPANGTPSVNKAVRLVENFISGALTDTGEYQDREYEATPSKDNCKWCLFKTDCAHVCT